MNRVRTRLGAALATVALGASALAITGGTAHAVTEFPNPQLTFSHTITSHPFSGAPANASDIEGLGDVGPDNSIWVADDNADSVWEIDATTGAYKAQLRDGVSGGTDFHNATKVGTGVTCAQAPTPASPVTRRPTSASAAPTTSSRRSTTPGADVLYVTSGGCCTANLPVGYPMHPTVWKLTRQAGHFVPTQWQALPEGQDPTAAGWLPGTGIMYGKGTKIKTYDFGDAAHGSDKTLPVVDVIVGLAFTNANTAFVTTATTNTAIGRTTATSDSTVHRFDISGAYAGPRTPTGRSR